MNAYKYKAFMEIQKDISSLENRIAEKQALIGKRKEEIDLLEKEIAEYEKCMKQAMDFKNELESGDAEKTAANN